MAEMRSRTLAGDFLEVPEAGTVSQTTRRLRAMSRTASSVRTRWQGESRPLKDTEKAKM